MNEIVRIINNQAVTTTLTIAEGVGRPHHGVIQLVRQHQADFEEFGPVAFEMRLGEKLPQGGFGASTEYAILNEHQAVLLMTYMRNTEVIRNFKKALITAFFQMASALQNKATEEQKFVNALAETMNRMFQLVQDSMDKMMSRIERIEESGRNYGGIPQRVSGISGNGINDIIDIPAPRYMELLEAENRAVKAELETLPVHHGGRYTPREEELMLTMAEKGFSTREIAKVMRRSRDAVKKHLQRLLGVVQ